MCTEVDFLLKVTEIPGMHHLYLQGTTSANLNGHIWGLKLEKCVYARLLSALDHRWWCLGGIQLTVGSHWKFLSGE